MKKVDISKVTKCSALSLLVGSVAGMANIAEANTSGFTNLGSGSEIRSSFSVQLPSGIQMDNHGDSSSSSGDKSGEGKCGEGKCGEGKCGEGKTE